MLGRITTVLMQTKFEEQIEHFLPQFFSFSFIFVPDQLQAQQLVIDSSTRVAKKNPELLKLEDFPTPVRKMIQIQILKEIYGLGAKRFRQLHKGLNFANATQSEYFPFLRLEAPEKAVLFLKHKLGFSEEQMEDILGMDESKITALLNHAEKCLGDELKAINPEES